MGTHLHDDTLDIWFAAAGAKHDFSDVVYAQTFALYQAVSLADRSGVWRAISDTDCLVLKQAISSNAYDLAPLGALFSDIRFKLRNPFIEAKVLFMHRVHVTNQRMSWLLWVQACLMVNLESGSLATLMM